MQPKDIPERLLRPALTGGLLFFLPGPVVAHEAWLLTPDEIEWLAAEPIPPLFQSHFWLGLAALVSAAGLGAAVGFEGRFRALEARLAAPFVRHAGNLGPLILRLGLAAMLILAGLGGLPRHGTAPWTQPTLLVPDMQIGLLYGWDWLATLQIVLGLILVLGIATRLAGLLVIALSLLGLSLFGADFLSYTPHFAAPGLLLLLIGGGAFSADRHIGVEASVEVPDALLQQGWRLVQILVGGGFIYLAVAYKLTQPTLLIAILQHGDFPSFGVRYPVIALTMTWVEIVCGVLLVLGRCVRPVSLVIMGAISVLAVTLGETPLLHANLYGVMTCFLLAGDRLVLTAPATRFAARRIEA